MPRGRTPPQVLGDGSDHDHLLGYGRRLRVRNVRGSMEGSIHDWLVVWNMFYFSIYWGESSQLTNIFQVETTNQVKIWDLID